MKYTCAKSLLGQREKVLFLERACSLQRARKIVGGEQRLRRLRRAGWLKPVKEGKRETTFNQRQVHEAFARVTEEGEEALLRAAA